MKCITLAALGVIALVGAGTATAQKIIGPDKPATTGIIGPEKPVTPPAVRHDAMKAGPGGGPWRGYGSGGGEGLGAMLDREGRFSTFLAIVKAAGWDGDGKTGFCDGSVRPTGWDGDGKAGFCDGSVHPVTVLAPDDAAFAAMDKAKLMALTSDKAAARAFVMAHVVGKPLKVTDLFYVDNPTSVKLFKSANGDELKLLCDGRAHVGLHHPRINDGMARVGDMQDLAFSGGVIQEIDGLLVK